MHPGNASGDPTIRDHDVYTARQHNTIMETISSSRCSGDEAGLQPTGNSHVMQCAGSKDGLDLLSPPLSAQIAVVRVTHQHHTAATTMRKLTAAGARRIANQQADQTATRPEGGRMACHTHDSCLATR
jgi:hypothetical protein